MILSMRPLSIALAFFFIIAGADAHPQPDVPVRTFFDGAGQMQIKVEIDPRCWAENPNTVPYMQNQELAKLSDAERAKLLADALAFGQKTLEFVTEPAGLLKPVLEGKFTSLEDAPLDKPDAPVVVTCSWIGPLPAGLKSYGIHAFPERKMAVVFHHFYKGQALERFGILFPGESSYLLDIAALPTMPIAVATPPENVPTAASAETSPKPSSQRLVIAAAIVLGIAAWWRSKRKAAAQAKA